MRALHSQHYGLICACCIGNYIGAGSINISRTGKDFVSWVLPRHYTNVKHKGGGGYGFVAEVDELIDGTEVRKVVVKKLKSPWKTKVDAQRAWREIRFLPHFLYNILLNPSLSLSLLSNL